MYDILPTFELVCLALGASSALIFDAFFMLSLKDHKLLKLEIRMLRRISLLGVIAAFLSLCFYIGVLITDIQTSTDIRIGFSTAKLLILGIAFLAGLTERRIHLPALIRHQRDYFHLSEKMIEHQDPFIATAALSTVSWLAVIFLSVIEARGLVDNYNATFLGIAVTYLLVAYILSRLAVFLKNRVLTR